MGYNSAMQDAVVRARIDAGLKADTEKVFANLGMDMTSAIRIFLNQVRLHQGLPFSVTMPDNSDLLLPTAKRQAVLHSLYDD